MSLLSRIFLTNAAVMAVAAAMLLATPVTVSSPALLWEIVVIVGGLTAVLVINLFLLRRAFSPLGRLTSLMGSFEPLRPGRRVPAYGEDAEIVELTRAFNDMLDRLEAERQDSVRRSLQAQEGERLRLAQELHDEIGQSLTAVVLQLERLTRSVPEELRQEIADAREAARASLDDIRMVSRRLRPEALDDLGLPAALAALTDRLLEQTGSRIERHIDRGLPPLGSDVELVVYRVAQEALTNALRHGEASRISLSLTATPAGTTLTVVDDGCGFDSASPGAGIQGMRERALMVDGDLKIDGRAGAGTTVTLRIPDGRPAR